MTTEDVAYARIWASRLTGKWLKVKIYINSLAFPRNGGGRSYVLGSVLQAVRTLPLSTHQEKKEPPGKLS